MSPDFSATISPQPRWRRTLRVLSRLWLAFILLLGTAAIAGTAFNDLSVRHYRALLPVPGEFYSVNGYSMHLYCAGAGSPAIILETGRGGDWTDWGTIQPELQKVTRVCSYDRAGLGWSEPRPGPRDAAAAAEQLRALLTAAGIHGPMVLMGRSIGALYLRVYLDRYPQGVVGLVLVDGSVPEQNGILTPLYGSHSQFARQLFWGQVRATVGITRLLGKCGTGGEGAYRQWSKANDACFTTALTTDRREYDAFSSSCAEAQRTRPFGDLPILIFSQDPAVRTSETSLQFQAKISEIWNALQENLKHLSTRSRRIIARGSRHNIPSFRPELVIREVAQFILEIRGTTPVRAKWNSTVTE